MHVVDVAEALSVMLTAPRTSIASTFTLPGPEVFSYDELLNLVSFFTMRARASFVPPLPKFIAETMAALLNRFVWFPTVCPDEIRRKFIDDAGTALETALAQLKTKDYPKGWAPQMDTKKYGVNGEIAKSWADLDIEPSKLQDHAVKYLRIYRNS